MKPSLSVRALTDEERTQLEAERRVSDAFRVRRAQTHSGECQWAFPQAHCAPGGLLCANGTQRHCVV